MTMSSSGMDPRPPTSRSPTAATSRIGKENGMSQHTPGPWTLGGTGNGYQYHIWPLDESGTLRRKIATVCHEDGPDPGAARTLYHDTEAESNARLIAAAPEMY